MYVLSQFTIIRNLGDRGLPSHNLVFTTRRGVCLALHTEDWDAVLGAMRGGPATDSVAAAVRQLAKDGIIVPVGTDERALYHREFDAMRYGRTSLYPVLAVTTACNLACSYCYEEGIEHERMSDAVVERCLRWAEKRIVEEGVVFLQPGLFGGEPLLYEDFLLRLMERFNQLRDKYHVGGGFYCSTNGVTLRPDLARALAERHLLQIQISLDGPRDMHNTRRIWRSGAGSFDAALAGIRAAVQHIPSVTIKINFDRHNLDRITEVFDIVVAEGWVRRVDVKLEAIAHQMLDTGVCHPREVVIPPDTPEMAVAYQRLMLLARERGIRVSRDTAHTTPCMFSSDHGVIIGPDGSIYKCISLVGRREFKVGSVFDEGYDRVEYNRQMDMMKRVDDCFEERCPYVPLCAGGCAYEAIVREGTYNGRFCTRPFLTDHYYLQLLVRHRTPLERLGIRPVTAVELVAAAIPAPAQAIRRLDVLFAERRAARAH